MASKKPPKPRKEGYQEEPQDRWPYPPIKREYDKTQEKEEPENERPPKPRRHA